MPLKKGSSRKTVSHNIEEMIDSYKEKGSIGNSKPASKKKALKQATAIALKKAGKSKYSAKAKVSIAKKSITTKSRKSTASKTKKSG